jgi:hypothetical protein
MGRNEKRGVKAMATTDSKGGEATTEEAADGEKATPMEDPSEETTTKKTQRVKW